ncbi:MAG: hypothetical protein K6U87_04155 [Firmicutes bacterium]|nr:hypothetical protein [Bacillota bacterium]
MTFDLVQGGIYVAQVATSNPNIAQTQAAQTITTLLTSATGWIAGLGVLGGGLMIGYHGLMRMFSGGDAATDAHHLSAMKKVIYTTAIVSGGAGLVHFLAGLF